MNSASTITVDDFPPKAETRKSVASWYTPGLSDGLGDRLLMFDNTNGSSLELLRFRREFGARPAFEAALRARVDQLDGFRHPQLARVRAVECLGPEEGLALISNHTTGRRLSEILHKARGPKFAVKLIRELAPVLAALHQQGDGLVHGALTADRIIVTPDGQLVIVEHVLGSALQSLHLPPSSWRSELRIAIPPTADLITLDGRTDVAQLAFVALSLLVGRRIDPADYPREGAYMLDEFAQTSPRGSSVSPQLREWLERALQLDGQPFESAQHAHEAIAECPEEPAAQSRERGRTLHAFHGAEEPAALPRDEPEPDFEPEAQIDLAAGAAPTLLEYRPAKPEPVPIPQKQAATAPAPRQRKTVRWAAAFAALAVAEAMAIAILIYTRPTGAVTGGSIAPPPAAAIPLSSSGQRADPLPNKPGSSTDVADQTAAGAATTGRLEVTSSPSGARVAVDGVRRGVTPLTLTIGLGQHVVVVADGDTTSTRTVTVAAGGTSTLVMSLAPAGPAAGWLSINAPLDLQVREGGSLLGITSADRLMLPAGRHDLALSSAAVGFQTTLAVDIQPGKTTTASVTIPNGSLSINALPWANVWLDGRALGTTPFANLDVPLGTHEVLWRHPQLGDRRQTIVVTAKSPVRLVMDLSK